MQTNGNGRKGSSEISASTQEKNVIVFLQVTQKGEARDKVQRRTRKYQEESEEESQGGKAVKGVGY